MSRTLRGGSHSERRQAPRIDVFGQLHGYIVDTDQRVVVLDVSTGGLGLAVREPLEIGSLHVVRLTNRAGFETEVEVRIANVRESSTIAGTAYHVVGAELTRDSRSLNHIVDHLTSALSFDIDVA